MRVILFTSLLLITCLSQVQAQNYIPPSPDALGMAKLASTGVNLYTGNSHVNLPITQLSGRELTASVSLSYNASGHKVQEESGSVGLGWSLNAGGTITRMVRGLPDELPDGYCGVNNRGEMANATTLSSTFRDNVAYGIWDGEPDIFFFNFMGRSGKFFLDAAGIVYTVPYQDIVIKPAICRSGRDSWEIIDENGISYFFGSSASHRETSTYKKVFPAGSPSTNFVSSWHLSRVESPNKTDYLDFSYTSSTVSFMNYYYTKVEGAGNCAPNVGTIKNESTLVTVATKYPYQITSPSGSIAFQWSSERIDFPGALRLESVILQNSSYSQISKTRFEYSYFYDPTCTKGDSECKRLRLDKVYDLSPDPIATFTYNLETNLPSKDSPNIDHWGYYNSNSVDTWLPSSFHYDLILNEENHSFSGASRQPSFPKGMANILTKIESRGGGYKLFTYEPHDAIQYPNTYIGIGGLRIKYIEYNDGINQSIVKSYHYLKKDNITTSGQVFYVPIYYAYRIAFGGTFKRFSHSLTSTFDLNGSHIGYSRVIEKIDGQGSNVHTFSNYEDSSPATIDIFGPTWGVADSYSWERGNVKKQETYNSLNRLVSRVTNNYNFTLPVKRSMKGVSTSSYSYDCNPNGGSRFSRYDIISRPFVVSSQILEQFDPLDTLKVIRIVNDFEYDPTTYQLTKTAKYNQAKPTEKFITKNKFVSSPDYYSILSNGLDCEQEQNNCYDNCNSIADPFEKSECQLGCNNGYYTCIDSQPVYSTPMESSILELKRRHQISIPIETTTIYQNGSNSKVLDANIMLLKTIPSTVPKVFLAEIWSLKEGVQESNYDYSVVNSNREFIYDYTKFSKKVTYDAYDNSTGRLLQTTSSDGVVTNYTWTPDRLNELSTSISTLGLTTRTTNYVHKSHVGPTSVIDANGTTIKYEYDVFNRLSKVKDENNHIMKQYRYHYQNETPGFRITSIKESNPGDNVIYYATDVAASAGGNPQLVWDMGDGRVVDNNSTQVSHAYAAPGTYTVKLAGLNPEYGPVTRTQQITVYPVVSGSICADGPIQLDLCGGEDTYFDHCPGNQNTYPSSPVTFTFNVTGGCPSSYTYAWKYKKVQDAYWFYSPETSNQYTLYDVLNEGTYIIECVVTDGCGKTYTGSYNIIRFKSNPQCGSGGVGIEN
ncbi:hypothetical protein SanaruYs_06590 [Chryseotalea sanaruensis]|uniref:PKD domain-containing protein n=1 Tax=Chryseotalea sanaruensis TaxID=2482724 RepID=A0A401U659_9BACT|nr:PKD domain-containing protein [Chryseotalea sanaruensis]GCC50444.1 hypothetical protein SanaruYs_06590 [Chryseotalea sanaruensis]